MKSFLTIQEIRKLIDEKQVTEHEVVTHYHERLRRYNNDLNAAIEIFDADMIEKESYGAGVLAGIPGILKDNICQKGSIASCGSKILSNFTATYDATVTSRLNQQGAVVLGRANMDEFAMGSSGEFSAYGATKNPWDPKRSPGGSSSGSAAAVAAGLVPWALGTETGGSVRQPAAFCGLVGLYPTYGLFSRFGVVAFASSTDQPGPLTKTVYDNATVASVIGGHDHRDSTSLPEPKRDYTKKLDGRLPADVTIGVLKDAVEMDGINPEIRASFEQAVNHLERMGAKIKYVSLPDLKYGISIYFILSRAEAASNLARFDGSLYGKRDLTAKTLNEMYVNTRHDGFGVEVKRRILMGNYVLSSGHQEAYYKKAQRVRSMMRAEFESVFTEVDVIISPTTTTFPFQLGKEVADPLAMYMADYFTLPNCITGLPALAVPSGYSPAGLPMSVQFMGPRLSEELLYQIGYAFEQSLDVHSQTPQGFE